MAFGLLAWQSYAILGIPTTLAYSRYTHLYTPRHVYGFGNGNAITIGDPANVLHANDSWPINLTFQSGLEVAWKRLKSSLSWTLGIVPLAGVTAIILWKWFQLSTFLRLLFASLLTMQIAHVPYWLDGTLGHHYVFETILPWALLTGAISGRMLHERLRYGNSAFVIWMFFVIIHQGANGHFNAPAFFNKSRVFQAANSIGYFSNHYESFKNKLREIPENEMALVIVKENPAHMHVEFTRSRPPFNDRILVGRDRPDRYRIEKLRELFPDRQIYYYDSMAETLKRAIDLDSNAGALHEQPRDD